MRLLCAQTRIARDETIPRLELRAAHLLANLMHKVRHVLDLQSSKMFLWSDSNIVLAWIKTNTPSKLIPFVKNRVIEIRNYTKSDDWHWVPSADNPADLLSRGVPAAKLAQTTMWWQGPTWLSQPNIDNWPPQNECNYQHKVDIISCVTTEPQSLSVMEKLFKKYSTYERLLRVFAYVLRFLNNVKNKDKCLGVLSVEELKQSHDKLIMLAQIESFPNEYLTLKKDKPLPQTSNILCLKPYMENGLLRVGGRIENSPYSHNKKHPILLHNRHILTKLIVPTVIPHKAHACWAAVTSGIDSRTLLAYPW